MHEQGTGPNVTMPREFRIQLTKRDIFNFSYYVTIKNKFLWAFCAATLAALLVFRYGASGSTLLGFLLGGLLIGVPLMLLLLAMSALLSLMLLRQKDNKTTFAENRIQINEDGFRSESSLGRGDISWSTFHDVARYRGNLYLFINPKQALILPARHFADASERDAMYGFLKERIGKQ